MSEQLSNAQRLLEEAKRQRELQENPIQPQRMDSGQRILAAFSDGVTGGDVTGDILKIKKDKAKSEMEARKLQSEAEQKIIEAQDIVSKADPNSQHNVEARDMMAKFAPGLVEKLGDRYNQLTDDDLERLYPKFSAQMKEAARIAQQETENNFKKRQLSQADIREANDQKNADRRFQLDTYKATKEKKDKKANISDSKRNAAGFAVRAKDNTATLDKLSDFAASTLDASMGMKKLQSEKRQQLEAAENDFIAAVLRKESGAAISDSEFEQASKRYIPQYGDGPQVLAQKKKAREKAIAAIEAAAGDEAIADVRSRLGSSGGATESWASSPEIDNEINAIDSELEALEKELAGMK